MNLKMTFPAPGDDRMTEILDSVRTVFAAKGFDRASMQDLAQAAEMSAGNFYRYFASKDAIIEAMVERDLAKMRLRFAAILAAPDSMALVRAGLTEQLDLADCDEGAIWCEIAAAAKRRAEVGMLFDRMEAIVTGHLVEVFGKVGGVDAATAEARYRAPATLIFLILQGIKMRRREGDDFAASPLRALSLKTLNAILDEIAPAGAPDRTA